MQVRLRELARGIATFLPVIGKYACGGTGGTASARYCYSVWMRHLVSAQASGYTLVGTGGKIAELGPGDSLGIGLAAMLSGFDEYFALDVKAHACVARNLDVFMELVTLFSERAPIPGDQEFPLVLPRLHDYSFPHLLLTDEIVSRMLDARRVGALCEAIQNSTRNTEGRLQIAYVAPWTNKNLLKPGSIDVAFSQAVLEHVEDIESVYESLHHWLRPGGFMSHTIDYQSHGLTRDWNGHWTLSDLTWKLTKGSRPYLINRFPYSFHRALLDGLGFEVIKEIRTEAMPISRNLLSARFASLSDEDLRVSGAFIQAVKPAVPL